MDVQEDWDGRWQEEFNKALGEVYESKPTQEMFEQKVEVNVEAENTVRDSMHRYAQWRGLPRALVRTKE